MKNHRGLFLSLLTVFAFALCLLMPGRPLAQEVQTQSLKPGTSNYELITDSDLYCSFYMLEQGKPMPDIQIIGAERMNEKVLLEDSDLIYINRGKGSGVEIGQLFEVVGLESKVPPYGSVVQRRCRARVVRMEDTTAVARLERTCSAARVGDYLLPYEEREGEINKDKGFDVMDPNASKHGLVIYVEQDSVMVGAGNWALINMGRQHCVQIGDQLTVFHRAKPNLPREAVASLIIIDVRGATSTVKVLSGRDTVEVGDEVQLNISR